MNKLIEIIKPYFDHPFDGVDEEAVKNLADKLTSSGLIGPQIQDVLFGIYPDGYKEQFLFQAIQNKILQNPNKSQFSDGYHTFEELYKIRLAYNVALFNEWASQAEYTLSGFEILPVKHDVHKSTRHHDGELCFGGGWFIVAANLPSGQISNHYEMKHWDLFRIPSYEKAKYEWDVHTTDDVIKRLICK
jgi:hypothetical protein